MIEETVRRLGDGAVITLESGEKIFQLDSFGENPVVKPWDIGLAWHKNGKKKFGAVFNPGAVLHEDRVILAPRCHMNYEKVKFFDEKLGIERYGFENYVSEIWLLTSKDGVKFEKLSKKIKGDGSEHKDFTYGIEDVRIVNYKEKYLLVGCGKIKPPFKGTDADRIAIYSTKNFEEINYHGIISCFDGRNAVPIFLNNEVYMVLRFHPNIYLAPLKGGIDQLLNPSDYLEEWKEIYDNKESFLLLEAGNFPHEKEKIGAGPPPIKTDEGWLLIYHAVGEITTEICKSYGLNISIERGYSICAAILDPDDPRKVLCRTKKPIYIPSKPYELFGDQAYPVDVPAVVFPTGIIQIEDKLLLYCGAGDKYVILLGCSLKNLLNYMFEHCSLT